MPIHNQVGIPSYSRTMKRGLEGAPAMSEMPTARPYINPLPAQVTEFTVGGTAADGTYQIWLQQPGADEILFAEFERGAAEANDAIGDALQADADARTTLAGILESTSDTGTATFDATFVHEGIEYEFRFVAPSGATITSTNTTDPAGSAVPLGRFVVAATPTADGQRSVALPSGAAETDLIGVVMRPLGVFENTESGLQSSVDGVPAGSMCDVAFDGAVLMRNVGASAAVTGGSVFVVVNTAGGDELGEAASVDDGANRVELPARNAYWAEETPAGEIGPVYLRL